MRGPSHPFSGYFIAVAASLVALGVSLALQPFSERAPFPPFMAAVAVSAWYGGRGPGCLATLLGVIASLYAFETPPGDARSVLLGDLVRVVSFGLAGLLIVALTAGLGAARERAERARAYAERAAGRSFRLQAVTGSLSRAATPADVTRTLVEEGTAALAARAGLVALLVPGSDELEVAHSLGYPDAVLERYRRIPLAAALPLSDAARGGSLLWLASPAALAERYPALPPAPATLPAGALVVVPLQLEGRALGALGVSFAEPRPPDDDDSAFLFALARQGAQALERARLLAAEQAAREAEATVRHRLAFLADASRALASSLDVAVTLETVARLAVPLLADWCVVDALDHDGAIRLQAVAHADAEKETLVRELRRRYPPDPNAAYGLPAVLRTGQPALYPDIRAEWRAAAARDAEHLALMQALGSRSSMCVPLLARDHILGAITLVAAESGRRFGPDDLALAEELARRAGLAMDNARLYGEARAAVQTRDHFLASVSHDLRNPLAAIRGHADMLRRQFGRDTPPDPARVRATLDRIHAVTDRMAGYLDELVDLSRLGAGRPLELARRPTDLVALTRGVADELGQQARGHTLRLSSATGHLEGLWDATRLERVIQNLLANAIKYSPDGGDVEIALGREHAADGDRAVLRVRDHGLGIPAADLPRISERYFRAGNVSGRLPGTGLGLAGARRIVEQHGGTLAVESEEGEGSTFTVRLPLGGGTEDGATREA